MTGTGSVTETVDRNGNVTVTTTGYTKGSQVGTVTYGSVRDGSNAVTGLGIQTELAPDATGAIRGKITLTNALGAETNYTLTYIYNNVYVPQNDIPVLNARMESIPLFAHARRIAVNRYAA